MKFYPEPWHAATCSSCRVTAPRSQSFFWNKHETVTACDNRYPADVTTHMCAELHIYGHMIIWLWYTAWKWNRWINNISAIGLQLAVASCQHCGKKWMPPYLQYKNAVSRRSNCNFSFWRLVTWGCQCSWCRQEQCRWRFAGSEKSASALPLDPPPSLHSRCNNTCLSVTLHQSTSNLLRLQDSMNDLPGQISPNQTPVSLLVRQHQRLKSEFGGTWRCC